MTQPFPYQREANQVVVTCPNCHEVVAKADDERGLFLNAQKVAAHVCRDLRRQ